MSTNDILKLIIVSLLIMTCMLVVLIIVGEKYIQDNAKVAQNNVQERIEIIESPKIPNNEQGVVATTMPTVEPTDSVIEEVPTPRVQTTIPVAEPTAETSEEIDYPKDIYYIKVNNQMNTVTVYTKDENGEYTKPIKAMICSTGEETPQNCTHKLTYKRWEWRPLFGNVQGHYTTQINGNILFHSVPYLKQSNNTLEYWEYDKLGTTASAGCVRLTVEDAKWIYEKCLQGTFVEFYNSSDPGPLGKPTAMKISDYIEYRDWDPTDPNENNPWNNIL